MSKEKPTDDPRQQTDWGSHKQTDKPWKGNPEKEQRPGSSKPDLEKWHETNTHYPPALLPGSRIRNRDCRGRFPKMVGRRHD
jgi:hypothetical protein